MIYKIHFKPRVEATKTAWQPGGDGKRKSDRLVCSIERTIAAGQADEMTPYFYVGEISRPAVYPAIFIFPLGNGDFRFQLSPLDLTGLHIPEGMEGIQHALPVNDKNITKALAITGELHRMILEHGRDCPEAAAVILNSPMSAAAENAILRDTRQRKTRLAAVPAAHMLLRWDFWASHDGQFPTIGECFEEMQDAGFEGDENAFKDLRKKLKLPPLKRVRSI